MHQVAGCNYHVHNRRWINADSEVCDQDDNEHNDSNSDGIPNDHKDDVLGVSSQESTKVVKSLWNRAGQATNSKLWIPHLNHPMNIDSVYRINS